MTIAPGTRLGPYRIHRPVGRGGFSTVYLASDDRLDCDVAVKVLADNWALDPEIRSRFLAEGQQLRAAANPNLIALYDVGETDSGQPYLVLAYAERGSLADRLAAAVEAGVVVDEAAARRVADALAGALQPLHDRGLVHRDVAPDNLLIKAGRDRRPWSGDALLDEGETLILADLGLAKDLTEASGITAGVGTDRFRPPEQAGGSGLGVVDARSDVWAASAVVTTILTGSSDLETRSAAVSRWPALEQGLAPNPDDRPPDMAAWRRNLEADFGLVRAAEAEVAGSRRPRLRWVFVGIAALGLGVGVASGFAAARAGVDDGPAVRRVTVDNGLIASSSSVEGVTLTVTGPATIEVDRTVTATLAASDDVPTYWLAPDGSYLSGSAPLELTPRSEGEVTIRAVALIGDGQTLTVDHQAVAVEP